MMSHTRPSFRTLCLSLLGILLSASLVYAEAKAESAPADEVIVDVASANPAPSPNGVSITFSSASPGNFFLPGQTIELVAHVHNPGEAQDAKVSVIVTTGLGCVVYSESSTKALPAKSTLDFPITLGATSILPNGSYLVGVLVDMAYGATRVSVWNGPAAFQSSLFGVSYAGPLNTKQTTTDLDRFKQAGINWIRFPLQGWIPQGEAAPAGSDMYDTFVREASNRGMSLLAAFLPQVSVDPSVDPVQAEKDFRESLLAATTRYAFKVPEWELLPIKPKPYPVGLKGISYDLLASGRTALTRMNKGLHVVIGLDTPIPENALRMFFYKLPANGDAIGIHYNFVGIPENQNAAPKPPVFEMTPLAQKSQKELRHASPVWATEYGFDPTKKLPQDVHQAALLARAVILNRAMGIERTFWRHDPASHDDLPLTCADGSAQPSLLALRTTLEALDGVREVQPVARSFDGVHLLLLRYGSSGKKRSQETSWKLVAWSETDESRAGMVLKTAAKTVAVTDLWGNTVELHPVQQTAIFQVDEYPRFINLGNTGEANIINLGDNMGFATKYKVLTPGGEQNVAFNLRNNQQYFTGNIAGELRFTVWPAKPKTVTQKFALSPYEALGNMAIPLTIPDNQYNGKSLYTVT
ncbi:MAG TPA: hypothetical protein VGL77_13445, partial [Armatimonadota bacterium]